MKLYLMRHGEAEWGEPLDSTRALTSIGLKQSATMAEFMVRQVGRVDLVLSSWFKRARDTADPMSAALGNVPREDIATLDPDAHPSDTWSDIQNLAELHNAADVLVVGHHPLIDALVEYLCGASVELQHAAILAIDIAESNGTKILWLLGPQQVQRGDAAVIEAAIQVTEAVLSDLGAHFDEKKGDQGSYYMDTHGVKRWVLGDGGASGNCDVCEENADAGWIDEDDTYPNSDEPPAHPYCTCSEETKEKRFRVYV